MRTGRRSTAALLPIAVALVSCSSGGADTAAVATSAVTSTTVPATTSSSSTSTSTSTTSSTTTTTLPFPEYLGEEVIGTSVEGRPITVQHRGDPNGIPVLVVGVIHGDENDGLAILDLLRSADLPAGVDLYLMDAMNPDGLAHDVRGNAHGVDLNRNFPHDWTAIAEPGQWEYSGTGPASEPETQAFIDFVQRLRPALTIWYHQDAYCIAPSKGPDRDLRVRYAEITGLPMESVTGGIYTGVAATYVRTRVPDAMSFIVELAGTLPPDDAVLHTTAVVEVLRMLTV